MKRVENINTLKYIGKEVKVSGWVGSLRSHGKIIFVDLRDKSAVLQLVFTPKEEKIYKLAQTIRPEWIISVQGQVKERPKGMVNPKVETGKIEISVKDLEVLSEAKTLPFAIDTSGYEITEEKRLRYRYLDLRRERLRKNLIARQKVIQFMRGFLETEGFIEVETPILTKSTPEGARDFLVPSRTYPGKFYALPQSPQQYKQLLQVAGIEKYFQIARCFRDEDPRADRQAEFSQLDLEMSFMDQGEILDLIERLFIQLVRKLLPEKRISKIPFPRISYKEAMKRYKTDKPDLRRDKKNPDELAFAFIVDFPMFEWRKEEKRWDTVHHPFTRPKIKDIKELKKNPGKVLAHQYDFVLNGHEVGGGSLRSYKPEILEEVFVVMGHKKKEVREKFGHILRAFDYGVPPHGGIAPGIDRFMAVILNEPNIREVMAFPKTGDNQDLMMNSPDEVSEEQLKELYLKIVKPKKRKR
ncbi:MAG TPA: aspartate--tRNA ligase [Candidatus Parcubacteria bacterium]|jgi:aspartyl-tRNA synthetase|nr:aspartate--tRNA ligase [Candidatus Parcubacteria bacterium]